MRTGISKRTKRGITNTGPPAPERAQMAPVTVPRPKTAGRFPANVLSFACSSLAAAFLSFLKEWRYQKEKLLYIAKFLRRTPESAC